MESQYHAQSVAKPLKRSIFLKTALNFAQRGIPVFPLKGKQPLTPHGYKDASAHPPKVTALFNAAPNATGIGIPTGSFSGLVVGDKDSDSEEARRIWDSLPPTLEVATGRASGLGRHGYYRVPKGTKVKSRKLAEGLELKADGCYVVAPPSVHPSGARYRWVPGHSEIAPLPDDLIEAHPTPQPSRRREGSTIVLETSPILEGSRDNTLARIAGRLHDGTRSLDDLTADLLDINARRCDPPLSDQQVVKVARSIHGREPCKPTVEVSPRVLEVVEHLASIERPIKGMGGATGWSIYRAGLELLRRYGREHEDGLVLSVDVRTWAQMAGTTHTSVRRFIGRTTLIRVARKGAGRRSGEFVFVAPSAASGTAIGHKAFHSSSRGGAFVRSGTPSALLRTLERLRWGPGRIGKSRAAILHKLVECDGTLSRKELASRLGKKPESLRKPLKWLVDAGLLERVSRGVYGVADDVQRRVEDAREIAGEPQADRLQIARHDRERDAYRRRNTLKPTLHLANRKADGFISELERVGPVTVTGGLPMPEKVDGVYVHDALCDCYLCDIPPRYAKPWRGA